MMLVDMKRLRNCVMPEAAETRSFSLTLPRSFFFCLSKLTMRNCRKSKGIFRSRYRGTLMTEKLQLPHVNTARLRHLTRLVTLSLDCITQSISVWRWSCFFPATRIHPPRQGVYGNTSERWGRHSLSWSKYLKIGYTGKSTEKSVSWRKL